MGHLACCDSSAEFATICKENIVNIQKTICNSFGAIICSMYRGSLINNHSLSPSGL